MVLITIVTGVYKPTYNGGGAHCKCQGYRDVLWSTITHEFGGAILFSFSGFISSCHNRIFRETTRLMPSLAILDPTVDGFCSARKRVLACLSLIFSTSKGGGNPYPTGKPTGPTTNIYIPQVEGGNSISVPKVFHKGL